MKVVYKGREQKGWAKEYDCTGAGNYDGGCGARLLIEQGDLFQTSKSDYGGDTEYFVTFQCIECGVKTDIKNSPYLGPELPNFKIWDKTRPVACHGVCDDCDGHNCTTERCNEVKCKCGPYDNE